MILAFLDICIDNNDPYFVMTSVFRKKTFTGLFTNFSSFTSLLTAFIIRTLVDRGYKINHSLLSFNKDVKNSHIYSKGINVVNI